MEEQLELELRYSKKHRQAVLLDFIDTEDEHFINMCTSIEEYMVKEYEYESKNERVRLARMSSIPTDQIALEILCVTLPVTEIQPIQGFCTKLGYMFNYKDCIDGVTTAAELLAVTEGHYFDLYSHDYPENNTGTMGLMSSIVLPDPIKEELEATLYLPPMLSKPRDWEKNIGGGYLTINESVILGSINHHVECQSLDVINMLQSVPLELNQDILAIKEELGKDLDNDAQYQFDAQVEQSNKIYELFKGKPFYFVWKNDKRGRIYSSGYHINIQSYKYKRALVDFHKKEVIQV